MPMIPLGGKRILTPVLGRSWQRAAGGWTPTDITGCKLWIDFSDATTLFTDAGTTPVANDNDLIYQANDKSGQSNHWVQTTEGDRAKYKLNIQNSLSSARFDIDCYKKTISGVATIIACIRIDYDDTLYQLVGTSGDWNRTYLQKTNLGGDGYFQNWYLNGGYRTGTVNILSSQSNIATWGMSVGVGGYCRVNGQSSLSYDYAGISIGDIQTWGGRSGANWEGYFHEFIAYDSYLSVANFQAVEAYLNAKWAIY